MLGESYFLHITFDVMIPACIPVAANGILEINYKFKMLPALSLKIPLILEPKLLIDTEGLSLILVSDHDIYFKLPIGKLNETNQQ